MSRMTTSNTAGFPAKVASVRTVEADTPFLLPIFGFDITQGPPQPLGPQQFTASPTPQQIIQTIAGGLPSSQTITFNSAAPTPTSLFSPSPAGGHGNYQKQYNAWSMSGPVQYTLDLSQPCLLQVVFSVAEMNVNGVVPATLTLTVNGNQLPPVTDSNDNYHAVTFLVPASATISGINNLNLSTTTTILLQSVTASSTPPADLSMSYSWVCVYEGYVPPDGSVSQATSIQSGTTDSESTTIAFAESIGLQVNASEGVPFDDISEQLTLGFTATQSYQSTVTVSESTTTTETLEVTPAPGTPGVTFQFWQVCIVFETNGLSVNQYVTTAPFLCTLPDPASSV